MNGYEEMVIELRKKQAKLTKQQMQEVRDIYANAIKEIKKDIKKMPKDSLDERFLRSYQKEINKYIKNLDEELKKSITSNMKKAAVNGTAITDQMMKDAYLKAGIKRPESFASLFASIHDETIKNIISGELYKDGRTLDSRIWDLTSRNGKDIQYIISEGIAQKKSAIELAEDLETYVKKPAQRLTDWNICYPILKYKYVDANAMRLARTSINHAFQTATIQSAQNNEFIDGIEWKSALAPGRTCSLCTERNGQVFDKDKVPLDHPNGLCVMLPHLDGDLESIAKRIREEYNDKVNIPANAVTEKHKSENGKVNGNVNKDNINPIAESEIKKFSGAAQINKYFHDDEEYKEWIRSINTEEKDALEAYTSNVYKSINSYNRKIGDWAPDGKYGSIISEAEEFIKNAPKIVKEKDESMGAFLKRKKSLIPADYDLAVKSKNFATKNIEQLDKIIEKYELKDNIRTYRAVKSDALPAFDKLDDLIGKSYNDLSYMSTTPTINSKFIKDDMNYIFEITVPKGKGNGMYLEDLTSVEGECEFLLPKNRKCVITGVRKEGTRNFIQMEMMP